jgi:dienelactone hydrolase
VLAHSASGRRVGSVAAAVMLAAVLLAGCVGGPAAPLTVSVGPHQTLLDEPIHVRVSGAPAGAAVTVAVESTDSTGLDWRSSATFRADSRGRVDLDTAASRSGTYTGVAATGLIWSMSPAGRHDAAYIWHRSGPSSFTATVHAGASTASTTFERSLTTAPLDERDASLASDGFVGRFLSEPVGDVPRPAVLVIGGSEGGMDTFLAAMLAARGYPALAVAYFGEPGLPPALSAIPLEYFEGALRWLAAQPGVDATRIVVYGGSRGSEAAELLGVHDADQVHGVIAGSPSTVAGCSLPACEGPAWTLGGVPVPFTRTWDDPAASDNPSAVIPVEKIDGPVLLVCGEADTVWSSCAFSRAAVAALDADPTAPPHELVAAPRAGHFVNQLVPGEPEVSASEVTPAQHALDELALPDVWRHVLAFLAALP